MSFSWNLRENDKIVVVVELSYEIEKLLKSYYEIISLCVIVFNLKFE